MPARQASGGSWSPRLVHEDLSKRRRGPRQILSQLAVLPAFMTAVLCACPARAATPYPPDSSAAPRPALHSAAFREPTPLLDRRDALFAVAAFSAVAMTAPHDEWIATEANESHAAVERNLASSVQPLGNFAYVLPGLAASWLVARASGRTEGAGSIMRIGVSVCAAGAGALALKEVVGRPRPFESPGESDQLQPFSGHASFPSGHAAVSFALATAINRESSWRMTPWVTYSLATLVGWSRVHDHQHWTSDVVAGAALGIWSAHKVEDVLQPLVDPGSRARVGLQWLDGGPALAVTIQR